MKDKIRTLKILVKKNYRILQEPNYTNNNNNSNIRVPYFGVEKLCCVNTNVHKKGCKFQLPLPNFDKWPFWKNGLPKDVRKGW